MGCDIHVFREKKVNGEWVTADTWKDMSEDYGEPEGTRFESDCPWIGRNYALFGFLAGVRRDIPEGFGEPRGLPEDVSPEVQQESCAWDCDGHSHSWVLISELKEKLAELTIAPTQYSDYYVDVVKHIINLFADIDGDDHRLVFWFDN